MNSYVVGYEVLGGRSALLEASGNHPYVMLTTTGDVTGYRTDGLLAWIDRDPARPMVWALGDGPAAVEFTLAMGGGARWAHLPHLTPEQAAPLRSDLHDDWDQLTTWTAPPPVPGEAAVGPLDADAEVDALLDLAFPASVSRPGDPRVRRWYGVRAGGKAGGELVACAADRSRGGAGHIAGVAVHPDHRRRSLGTAVTAALTRLLHAEFGNCSLSVMSDASGPRRLYERLGYGNPLARTTVRPAP
ncbi:GNAT family N-acetyltransferase [Virgisporangium ochraceum]|uniref:GNAT family N-acetyltransferase n=1 Tax=Virgisporangium ochraceum TaxID=65505 RepID=UPI001943C234|nr:GNAT family N-acetyltransferase [Virgisporangium ochraceum]